jgi:hypothetical protein
MYVLYEMYVLYVVRLYVLYETSVRAERPDPSVRATVRRPLIERRPVAALFF